MSKCLYPSTAPSSVIYAHQMCIYDLMLNRNIISWNKVYDQVSDIDCARNSGC